MAKTHRFLITMLTVVMLTAAPAVANVVVDLNGAFSAILVRPSFVSLCPAGGADECGAMQLVGLGAADWVYVFGPTFEPSDRCFDVDGMFTLTLHSDGSTISGPLAGVFCPGPSAAGHQHRSSKSYGNPFFEDDVIHFISGTGTGQFEGLQGTASFHTFSAGAVFRGTLSGTLSQ
jgi:hypothetical protein